jgi:outer membrane receptor protein involved in Fe transport
MKKLSLLLCLATLVQAGYSQPSGPSSAPGSTNMSRPISDENGKISGMVVDAVNNQAVEYATVALVNPATDKPVDGTVCDDKGKFILNKVADGNYKVVISFIGYETQTFDVIISGKDNNVDLGTIKINSEAKLLNEVTVQGQKALVEERVDRTIYNAENDATAKGGDASDVLRRVPLLSVDLDGNVSMRGNSNITVLINNKPSTIMAGSVADALKQIPADQIKSVEVITSPSAKYDAEGSAGIINIITKKNTLEGATLNVDTGFGYRGSNLGLNGSFRRGKMGFNLGGFGRANYNNTGRFENTQITKDANGDPMFTNIQKADTRNNNLFGRYQLGWDYDIDKKNYLAASVRYGVRNGWGYQDNLTTNRFDVNDNVLNSELRNTESLDLSGTVDVDLTYTRTFNKPQRELSFLALFSKNNRTNDFENIQYDINNPDDIIEKRKNENKNFNREVTFQVDYQNPIKTNQMIEFGGKEIMRKVSSDFATYIDDGSGYQLDTDARQSNILDYQQNVTAGYLSYTYNAKSGYSIKAGSRYEHTVIQANLRTETADLDIPSYGVVVPSLNLSKKLKNNNVVKASYNRRIQRPSIRFLNPSPQGVGTLNVTIGNPSLDPEYTNNYEVSYSTFIKGTSLNFSSFMRNTTGAIQSIRQANGDTLVTRFRNIGQEDAYGLSVFANVNIGGKLMLNGGGDVYYAVLDNNNPDVELRAGNEGWVANYRVFGSYNLNKGWGFQFFGFYRSRQVQLQGISGGFGMYSVALRKEFTNKKGSVGFGIENFLTPTLKIKNETETPIISQNSLNTRDMLSFRVNFSYRLGKMSFDNQPRRRRKSISNDDLKDGGGDGGQFETQPTQQRGGGQMPSNFSRPANQTPVAEIKSENDSIIFEAAGVWAYTIESPQGNNGGILTIIKNDDSYSGTMKNTRQETAIKSITVEGNNISFSYTMNFGGNEVTIDVKAVIDNDDMKGTMSVGQFRTMPMTAKRQASN